MTVLKEDSTSPAGISGDMEMHLTYSDLAVYFSEEEWWALADGQRELYKEVMRDNYENLQSLGIHVPKPDVYLKLLQGRRYEDGGESAPCDDGSTDEAQVGENIQAILLQNQPQIKTPQKCENLQYCNSYNEQSNYIYKRNSKKPYSCIDCGKSYHKECTLIAHQKSHFKNQAYKCPCCEKSFRKPSHLRRHLKTHQVYECPKCQGRFRNKTDFSKHFKLQHKVKQYKCNMCQGVFQSRSDLALHQKQYRKCHQCCECRKRFSTKFDFYRHQKVHLGDNVLECKECGKVFTRLDNFTKHTSCHSSKVAPNDSTFSPDKVNRFLNEKPVLPKCADETLEIKQEAEKNVVHNEDELIDAPLCIDFRDIRVKTKVTKAKNREEFPRKAQSRSINQAYEDPKSKHKVAQNTKKNSTSPVLLPRAKINGLQKEKLSHVLALSTTKQNVCVDSKAMSLNCKKCKKRYRHRRSLLRHRKSHTQRFKCHQCGETFKKLVEVYIHRFQHSGKRRYKCRKCKKRFSFKSLLLLHKSTH